MGDGRSGNSEGETRRERIDRELIELLNELRVALPGVQFLFAFLLIVPFQQKVDQLTDFQRDVYFVALLAAATATAFLIAPSAYHRIAFQTHDKPQIIRVGTLQFLCGLVALAVAMNCAILLVTDVLFHATTVVITLAITVSLFAWLWFGVGLWRRLRR